MSKLKNIDIGISPLTNTIYLGVRKANGIMDEKIDITNNMINAVADVMKTDMEDAKKDSHSIDLKNGYKLILEKASEQD